MKEYKRDKRVLVPRDEFEEEAGEGLGRLSREEAEADLRELKARMERRVTRPRAIWLPAAAAVLILLVASGILVSLLRERPARDMQLAQKESSPEAEIIADSAYPGMTGEAVTDTALISMAAPVEKKGHAPGESAATDRSVAAGVADAADELHAAVEEDAGAGVVANDLAAANENAVIKEVTVANEVIVVDEPVVQMIGAMDEEAEEVVVEALPQVTMTGMAARSKKSDRDTAREADGNKEKAKVEAVEPTEPRPAAATEAKAATEPKPAAAAKAAAVQGAGVPDSPVLPAVGWKEYLKWVTKNIRYPEGVTPVVRQEVVVSFTVQADGTVSDLEVVRTPGEQFTAEAFRLLQAGPQWVPARIGRNAAGEEVILMFVFK